MTTETMTVHQALAELKTMDSRIDKAISAEPFVFANKHSNQKVEGMPIQEKVEIIKSQFQRVQDLITRRDAIKRAVVLSNANTQVVIGGKNYTVAEAIEIHTQGMEFRRDFRNKISRDYARAKDTAIANNGETLEKRADAHVANVFGHDAKPSAEDISRVRAEFIAGQTYELVDPLKVEEVLRKMDDEITAFEVNVDAALSVSNAITEIEISY